ncbi:putative uncharacterized protein [Clostridium sp. CAG:1013]|nr:putative uncharacterized protein [Clostridium sp. CAG:1013]
MRKRMRWITVVAAAAMSLLLTGCSLPMMGFADYDVSGYFQALLDSSYKGQNTEYVDIAATTEEKAMQNNTATVQNAAVNFCNTYGITPSDEQLTQLEEVMRQALLQADYTVKDEQKVDTGYYLEVEIVPIVNFSGLESEIDKLRDEAQDEASQAQKEAEEEEENSDSYDDSDGYDDYGYDDGYGSEDDYGYEDSSYDDYDDTSSDQESSQEESDQDTQPVSANDLFVNKVVEYCQELVTTIRYADTPVTISLDIVQTEKGELQLDTNQLDTIDRTVLQFQS